MGCGSSAAAPGHWAAFKRSSGAICYGQINRVTGKDYKFQRPTLVPGKVGLIQSAKKAGNPVRLDPVEDPIGSAAIKNECLVDVKPKPEDEWVQGCLLALGTDGLYEVTYALRFEGADANDEAMCHVKANQLRCPREPDALEFVQKGEFVTAPQHAARNNPHGYEMLDGVKTGYVDWDTSDGKKRYYADGNHRDLL